ncbi:MAG: hypothetical protein AB8B88_12985 [Devosiaceae bacterium]
MAIIRFPIRLLGLALLAIGLVLLADDLAAVDWSALTGFAPEPLGALLYATVPDWLNGSQAFIQRYVWPYLWDPIIQTALTWWDWAVVGVLGLVLAVLARRPKPRSDAAAIETAG